MEALGRVARPKASIGRRYGMEKREWAQVGTAAESTGIPEAVKDEPPRLLLNLSVEMK